jgi:hypothetical protein
MRISASDIIAADGGGFAFIDKFLFHLRYSDWMKFENTLELRVRLQRCGLASPEEALITDYIYGRSTIIGKNKVILDMEWSSDGQTFDRGLHAFSTLYEGGIIDCCIIITRNAEFDTLSSELGMKQGYGANTACTEELLSRIRAGQNGECPMLVVGITPMAIVD